MKRPYAACRYICGSLAAVTAVTSALPMTVMANTSSANFDMRKQVVNLTGILNVTDYTGKPSCLQRVRICGCAGHPSGCRLYPHSGVPGLDDRFPGRAL